MIPPSPSLSARMMMVTYLTVTTIISAQNTSDRMPEHGVVVGDQAEMRREHFLQRVQRTGADVAEDHADRADDQAGEADAAVAMGAVGGAVVGGGDGGHGPSGQWIWPTRGSAKRGL